MAYSFSDTTNIPMRILELDPDDDADTSSSSLENTAHVVSAPVNICILYIILSVTESHVMLRLLKINQTKTR